MDYENEQHQALEKIRQVLTDKLQLTTAQQAILDEQFSIYGVQFELLAMKYLGGKND